MLVVPVVEVVNVDVEVVIGVDVEVEPVEVVEVVPVVVVLCVVAVVELVCVAESQAAKPPISATIRIGWRVNGADVMIPSVSVLTNISRKWLYHQPFHAV